MTYTFTQTPKKVHTAGIEFKTKIFTSNKGYEQRQSLQEYPIKTFVLDFEKNQENREAIETLIKNIYGCYSQFYWTKPNEVGNALVWGSGKWGVNYWGGTKYLCRLAEDEMANSITWSGYATLRLVFQAIDDNPYRYTDKLIWNKGKWGVSKWGRSTLNDLYTHAYDYSLIHNTDLDEIITNNRQAYQQWSNPKRKWLLKFKKNITNRKKIEEFFISKKGRFKRFKFTWLANKGGDGNTYNVRFDTDKLDFNNNWLGYSTFSIPIIEVF